MPCEKNDVQISQREGVIAKAISRGFTKSELVDTHKAIALRAARLFARVHAPDVRDTIPNPAHPVLALLAYEGGEVTEEVEDAIRAIATLPGHVDTQALLEIAELIDLHASYSHSVPARRTRESWYNEITDISIEMNYGVELYEKGAKVRGEEMLRGACARLASIFGDLWS